MAFVVKHKDKYMQDMARVLCPNNKNKKDRKMPNEKIRVEYLDALAGAGKTRAAARWAVQQAQEQDAKIIIAQPSIYLLQQTINDIEEYRRRKNLSIRVTAIHGEDKKHGIAGCSAHVVGDITAHIKNTGKGIGEILLMTHAAFQLIPYFERKREWIVLWDEVLDPISDITLNINESFSRMLPFDDWFDVDDSEYPDCYLLTAKDAAVVALQRIAMNRYQDELQAVLQEFVIAVLSPHHRVYVMKDALHNFRNGFKQTDEFYRKLPAYSVQQASFFEGYQRFIVMSALFTSSTWYLLYQQLNTVSWLPVKGMGDMRYSKHQHGNIKFEYLTDKREIPSKNLFGKMMDGGSTVLAYCEQQLASYIQQPFVFQANKDSNLFTNVPQAQPLPYSSHGLNNFMDKHCYVDLAAYNSQSQFYQFCERFGLDEVITYNRTVHLAYQGLMRTAIRNPDDASEVLVILPTKKMCEDVAVYFPNSDKSICQCPALNFDSVIVNASNRANAGRKIGAVGRSNLWRSDAEGKRARKALQASMTKQLSHIGALLSRNVDDTGVVLAPTFIDPKTTPFTFTCFANTYRSVAEKYEVCDWDWFVNDLKKCHRDVVAGKKENVLICPATFDISKCEDTNYGTANVESAWCMFIDYDAGDAAPEMWNVVFPDIAKIVYSTYSSTHQCWRYRVVFHTDRAMSAEEYAVLSNHIASEFQKRFPNMTTIDAQGKAKDCGIDMSKLTACSLFYVPCQAQAGGKSFFDEHIGKAIVVDDVLKMLAVERPVLPTYSPPAVSAIFAINTTGATLWDKMPLQAKGIFDSMGPGHRSREAQRLAGIAKKVSLSLDDKLALLAAMVEEKKIDGAAQQSAKIYMGLR
jgi:hypothetical protein